MDQQMTDVARFFDLVSGIQIRARRTIEAGLRVRDLTFAQYSALLALSAKNGMSQAELAQALDTDSTTAMVLRTSLEKKRLVARVDDPADGRVKRIEISDAGKAAVQGALPEAKGLYTKALALLSEADLKRILPVLERLYAFVGETSSPRKEGDEAEHRKGRPRKVEAAAGKKTGKTPAKPAGKAKNEAKAKPAAAKRGPAKAAKPAPKAAPKAAAKAKPASKPAKPVAKKIVKKAK
jgi:MarR family transcriptional regulator for hemolysin